MTHADQARLKLGWCGPTAQGLAWLSQRLRSRVQVTELPALSDLSIDDVQAQSVLFDRLIVACPDRLALPWQPLQRLQCRLPELPIAVATSDWWNGASRTGLQQRDAFLLPWYRWLDGWLPWLLGSPAAFFEPLPHRLPYALNSATWRADILRGTPRAAASVAVPQSSQQPSGFTAMASTGCSSSIQRQPRRHADGDATVLPDSGLIVAGAYEIAQAWLASAQAWNLSASWIRPKQFEAYLAEVGSPAWLLWDDSCFDTTPTQPALSGGREFFQGATKACPGTLKLAALTMPRWDAWQELEDCGADELIAKPSTSAALAWSLVDRYQDAPSNRSDSHEPPGR